ncbi:hypothetical protein COT93_00915 [Candidatus Falkowbacteria bacterium CG10_big_fil_rev_8_21_14_0_10_37_18]|uniref:Uncharacterized protein n=1 Tax=Candidatus Falkowbacteria bacterium CG10_big_fil_rev_8_21_14_0_10_37_18 TaxID=1974562 RepID=A0A2H0V9C7_9BACT|nr:MAG: hypothetical protein COT93_00915 [Candidatus Falkowbacteria bacterium CG10_big_fil_rev_8_21_14_0_10_37_18]
MKKLLLLILILIFFFPNLVQALELNDTYPRLANYFLKTEISDQEATDLAKWDLLILNMETQESSPEQILKIRSLNSKIIMVAYIGSQEIVSNPAFIGGLRALLGASLNDSWWLRDEQGNKISNWPGTYMLNISDQTGINNNGQHWNDYLVDFVVNEIKSSNLWDGVFYDNVWGDISWLNGGNIDINNDGQRDNASFMNDAWSKGMKKIFDKTREKVGPNFIVLANGQAYADFFSHFNGLMLERFPAPWDNGGTWKGSIKVYSSLSSLHLAPSLPILNVTDKDQTNYRHFRFGLTSALLGDGFYSFDYDITDHGQTWWYDEYNWQLGNAKSSPYNLLAPTTAAADNIRIEPGLWRRDFANGLAIINSTDSKQTYIFSQEDVEKIKGTQDITVNNGQKINYIQLQPQDGVILLKTNTTIENSAFTNGYFFRYFNGQGEQIRNGFFPFIKSLSGESEVIVANPGNKILNADSGQLSLSQNGTKIWTAWPFTKNYKKKLSLAAKVDGGNFPIIITGAGPGGGPQVQIFNNQGKLVGSFFAYDKNLRCGVNVALADLDGDGQMEIITGPGPGTEPQVKVFSLNGQLKSSFLAYDVKMRGGINVTAGDLSGDGISEIITAPASAGGPQVRIFSESGRVLGGFFAYDKNYHGGLKVTVADDSGHAAILVGLKNFY